jgi:hypothetical protein
MWMVSAVASMADLFGSKELKRVIQETVRDSVKEGLAGTVLLDTTMSRLH